MYIYIYVHSVYMYIYVRITYHSLSVYHYLTGYPLWSLGVLLILDSTPCESLLSQDSNTKTCTMKVHDLWFSLATLMPAMQMIVADEHVSVSGCKQMVQKTILVAHRFDVRR